MSDAARDADTPDEVWRKVLTREQYRVCREAGTERAFSSKLYTVHEPGNWFCVACDNLLFTTSTKFDSGSGWPSFFRPATDKSVAERRDVSHGMVRVEVVCQNCHSHLGHVFEDGPRDKTGMRYCINGVALRFEKGTEGAGSEGK